MSIINQALQKAQREQLKHLQQEAPSRLPALRARAPRRYWLALPLALLVLAGLAGLRYVWRFQTPLEGVRQAAPAAPQVLPPPPTAAQTGEVAAPSEPPLPPPRVEGASPPSPSEVLLTEETPIRTALSSAALTTPSVPATPPPLPIPAAGPVLPVAAPNVVPHGAPETVEAARAVALLQRALQAQEAGALTRALTLLEQAVQLDPTAKTAYNSLGNVYYQQRRYQQALAMYQKALALDPGYIKARTNLGSTYMQLAMDTQAIEALHQALRIDSTSSLAYYNLACVYARRGESATAAQYLQQAITLEPQARTWAQTDADFARVRMTPDVQALLGP